MSATCEPNRRGRIPLARSWFRIGVILVELSFCITPSCVDVRMLRRWVLRAWVFLVLVILLSPAVWAKTDPVRSARRLGFDRPNSFPGFVFARRLRP